MIAKKDYSSIEQQLQACLAEPFGDVRVRVGDSLHYPGTNLEIVSEVFRGLLPEQRYHHVVRSIPAALYDHHLKDGVVWFELAPGETAKDLMRMPRSDDVAPMHDRLVRRLEKIGFFDQFKERCRQAPARASTLDFVICREILRAAGLDDTETTQACLLFIRYGGFCDVQVLADVMPLLLGRRPRGRRASPR